MFFITIIIGYLIGSIPIGYIYGKLKGIDVRNIGFKRIGASNIYKTFGFIPGVLVFFGDFLKPILAILIAMLICRDTACRVPTIIHYIAGLLAIIGHNWPLWLKFKGEGRGVASSFGFLYYLVPIETLIIFVALFPVGIRLKSTALLTFIFFCLAPLVVLIFQRPYFSLSLCVSLLAFISRISGGFKVLKTTNNKRKIIINSLLFDNPNRI
ncbi:MAG: glycerol-3-phosphate acyltransferase [Candidatus Stahlbacteria bacterium]|nr:glycerol-3-phosphate acyltransferase [Candidatus Stahlbacteria bacterium]